MYLEMLYGKPPLFYKNLPPARKRSYLFNLGSELDDEDSPYSQLPVQALDFLRVCLTADCRQRPCLSDLMQGKPANAFFDQL